MKKLLVLSLVLLLGVTGFAKTNYFENIYVDGTATVVGTVTFGDLNIVGDLGLTGNADFNGTTMLFDGSTSVRNVSAGFTSLEAAANRIGVSASIYMSIATAATTGITTITHTGSAPAVTWTADSLAFVGNFDVNGTTSSIDGSTSTREISAGFTSHESPANRLGLNATIYMSVATAATTGVTTITHTGSAPTVTWTADSFDLVGSISLDATTIIGGITHTGTQTSSAMITAEHLVSTDDADINDNLTVGDITVDEAAGVINYSGATSATLSSSTADITIDSGGGEVRIPDNVVQTGSFQVTGAIALIGGITHTGTQTSSAMITAEHLVSTDDADVNDNLTVGDIVVDEAAGVINYSGATSALLSSTTGDITIDSGGGEVRIPDNVVQTGSFQITGAMAFIGGITHTGTQTSSAMITAEHLVSTDDADVNDNLTVGDIVIDEAAGVLSFTGATSATVSSGTADITIDSAGGYIRLPDNVVQTGSFQATGAIAFIGGITHTGAQTSSGTIQGAYVDVTSDLDVDGISNLDVTDIDDTLNVQGITTFQANTLVANATNAGGMYVTVFNIAYTQTDSYTVGVIPLNADVVKVEVLTTTAFTGGSATTIDIGWSGTLEGYASDLAIRTAGVAAGDEYANMGDIGGSNRSVLAQITTDDSAGACSVQIYWTMGTPGTP